MTAAEANRLVVDRLIMEVGAVIRDQGVQECSSEALLFLSEIARREALRIIEIAQRKALYAGHPTVTERDACKAVVEALESFAPPNNLTFQTTEQALAKDINSFPLGEFPTNFVGLPLPPDDISYAQWRFSNQPE